MHILCMYDYTCTTCYVCTYHSLSLIVILQVNKSSTDFWESLKPTWTKCAGLPYKRWATSVAELDGKVYATVMHSEGGRIEPLMYDSRKNQWSVLPVVPYGHFSLVTVSDGKQLLAIGGMRDNNGVVEISNKVFLWNERHRKWTTPYPYMPTARCYCSSISHESSVIVAGGVTCLDPYIMTRAVEILHIKENSWFTKSHWRVVEPLPLEVFGVIPLIADGQLYIAVGYDDRHGSSTCNIVTASLRNLLQSSNKNTSSGQVWTKLPDMPYSSFSINHCQGRLITFSGSHEVEQPGEDNKNPVIESVPLIHVYNPYTKTWDCVGEISHNFLLGRSAHILKESKILFIGGLTGTLDKDDNIVTFCSILEVSSSH